MLYGKIVVQSLIFLSIKSNMCVVLSIIASFLVTLVLA